MKKILILFLIFAFFTPNVFARDNDFVKEAFSEGIIAGDENGDFHAEKIATRAEFIAVVVRFLDLSGGVNVFCDVSENDWFCDEMSAAANCGIICGSSGRAMPYEPVKCEDAVTILGRYYGAEMQLENTFGASEYAKDYFAYALRNDIIKPGYYEPAHYITKGEMLAILYGYAEKNGRKVHFMGGYPKISQTCIPNNISIDIKANEPSNVNYSIAESGKLSYRCDRPLGRVAEANTVFTANIFAEPGKKYDICIELTTGADSVIAIMRNVQPFAFMRGDGTAESPYIISDEIQLAQIGLKNDCAYKLDKDIEITNDWETIDSFDGILDGDGHRITGLSINSDRECMGLIGNLTGIVKNISVDGSVRGKRDVGLIAGTVSDGVIKSCTVTGTVNAKTNNAGGICGINKGNITNCLSAAESVTAGAYAGGISGQNYGEITKCISAAEAVTSDMYAGGISGTCMDGRISDCVAADITVYDTMTYNSGRLTTYKGGIIKNNYCYNDMISNAAYQENDAFSQNGIDTSFDELITMQFYTNIGFSASEWSMTDNGFRLAYPKKSAPPVLEIGKNVFCPKMISTAEELIDIRNNTSGHYVLSNNITLNLPWKAVGDITGFSGSLDGNGHTIYNLMLKNEVGMFANITGGTIKNLTIAGVSSSPASDGAVIAAINNGYIRNCVVTGKINTKRAGLLGGIAAQNNGEISNVEASIDITSGADNATIGGICGENSGVVLSSSYTGNITANGKSTVIGGAVGYDIGGYIIETFANPTAYAEKTSSYIGGVCAIASGSQIYKCSSRGSLKQNGGMCYAGGICGLSESAAIYNCFTATDVLASAKKVYSGGVCGYNSEANIQNTYAIGNITATGTEEAYAGGICGYCENGFVMQNVSLSPSITGNGKVDTAVAEAVMSEVSDNAFCQSTLVNSAHITDGGKTLSALKSVDFYFKPIAEGGLLGWDKDVWTMQKKYPFPVLTNVKGQGGFSTPLYK